MALCPRQLGATATFNVSAALCAASLAIVLSIKETLNPDDRKRFSLAAANPFANLMLLVRNGPGLRALSASVALFRMGTSVGSLFGPFQFDDGSHGLGW